MTFDEFKNQLVAVNPIHINRKIDACDWSYKGKELFHNRTFWGRPSVKINSPPAVVFSGVFNELKECFWAGLFTDKQLAQDQANKYGAEVVQDFYCDENNPTWFLMFSEFDKCALFVYDELARSNNL